MLHITIEEFCLHSTGSGPPAGIPKQEHALVGFAFEEGNLRRQGGQRADVTLVLQKANESFSIVDGEAG